MAARRKAPRRRARKSFNISAVEAGAAISLLQSTGAAGSVELPLLVSLLQRDFQQEP
jgi:hypothetical protein